MPLATLRAWICAALAVTATAATNLNTYGTSFRLPAANTRGRDLAHAFDARFRPLRPVLAGRHAVGYWTDDPDEGRRQLAQYAITPVILEPPAGQPLLLVDIRKGETLQAQPPVGGYVVVRELGPGLVLFEKRAAVPEATQTPDAAPRTGGTK